jgi:hypothetical protein
MATILMDGETIRNAKAVEALEHLKTTIAPRFGNACRIWGRGGVIGPKISIFA